MLPVDRPSFIGPERSHAAAAKSARRVPVARGQRARVPIVHRTSGAAAAGPFDAARRSGAHQWAARARGGER